MAKVILEIIQQGIHNYHKIDAFPVTVGRAFNNDIILQDTTISPHHLEITSEDGKYLLHSLSNENGTKYKGKVLGNTPVEINLPSSFKLSGLKARLLPVDMPVEKTYVKDCSGFFCFFTSPFWAATLMLITIGLFFFNHYISIWTPEDLFFYVQAIFPSIQVILGITIVISGICRLSTHRWEVILSVSIASMIFLLPQLFEYLGHFLAYLFTQDSLGIWFKYLAKLIVIPGLIAVLIVKTIHAKWLIAAGIAFLVYSPFFAYQVSLLVEELDLDKKFSPAPSYSQILLSSDLRLNMSTSLDQFITEADKATSSQVEQMLSDVKKKDAALGGSE